MVCELLLEESGSFPFFNPFSRNSDCVNINLVTWRTGKCTYNQRESEWLEVHKRGGAVVRIGLSAVEGKKSIQGGSITA